MFVNSFGTLPTQASSGSYSYAAALTLSPEPTCLPEPCPSSCASSCQDQYAGSLSEACSWSPAPVCSEPPASPRPPREHKAAGKKKACKHKMKKNMRMRTLETNTQASIMNSGSEGGNRGDSMGGMGGGSTGGCQNSGGTSTR